MKTDNNVKELAIHVGDSFSIVHSDFVAVCEVISLRPKGEMPVATKDPVVRTTESGAAGIEARVVAQVIQVVQR